jgi:acetoin utilization protein AcuC
MAIGILYSEQLKEYDFGPGHPFRGDRFSMFPDFLKEHLPKNNNYQFRSATQVTDDDLLLICSQDYIDFTKEYFKAANLGVSFPGRFSQYHSPDNRPIGQPGKLEEAARLIVGQAKKACDLIYNENYQKVISIGGGLHHAKSSYGEGFCLYNDVAFCGRYLTHKCGFKRVLILDTDAHAGNGTMDYFYEDPQVLFIDIHQDPRTLYPGTGFSHQIGVANGKGFTVNIPLPTNAGYESYEIVFESIIEPIVNEFRPQIIIRNGGSDPHFDDTLTNLALPIKGFRMIGEKVRKMAEICEGRTIDLIASGYNKAVLPIAWTSLISGLTNFPIELPEPKQPPQWFRTNHLLTQTETVINDIKNNLRTFWKCLQ